MKEKYCLKLYFCDTNIVHRENGIRFFWDKVKVVELSEENFYRRNISIFLMSHEVLRNPFNAVNMLQSSLTASNKRYESPSLLKINHF